MCVNLKGNEMYSLVQKRSFIDIWLLYIGASSPSKVDEKNLQSHSTATENPKALLRGNPMFFSVPNFVILLIPVYFRISLSFSLCLGACVFNGRLHPLRFIGSRTPTRGQFYWMYPSSCCAASSAPARERETATPPPSVIKKVVSSVLKREGNSSRCLCVLLCYQ